ncbi:hypothetical protein QA447_14010 [Pseudomonas sp. abacavir_1]
MAIIIAGIDIAFKGSQKNLSNRLSLLIGGIYLDFDQSGKYEEYPAYVSQCGPIEYSLLGASDDEILASGKSNETWSFCIYASFKDDLNYIRPFLATSLQKLIMTREIPADGRLDFSAELADMLSQRGLSVMLSE